MTTKELDCGDGKGISCVWKGEGESRCCANCFRVYADRFFDRIAYSETRARVTHALDNSSYGNERDAIQGALDAVKEWARGNDARPDDLAELARLVAVELRKRGIWAFAFPGIAVVNAPRVRPLRKGYAVEHDFHAESMHSPAFNNLGPIGCADVIQAEEAKRAQEWAGDT